MSLMNFILLKIFGTIPILTGLVLLLNNKEYALAALSIGFYTLLLYIIFELPKHKKEA